MKTRAMTSQSMTTLYGKYALTLSLGLLLLAGLGGCGDEATSSAEPGGKTPQELIDKLEALSGTSEDVSGTVITMVSLVHPEEQPAVAFMFSVLPLVFAPMSAMGADEAAKAKLEPLLQEAEGLLQRHGLEQGMGVLKGLSAKGELSDAEKLATLNEVMKGVDHMALLRETWTLLEKLAAANPSASELTVSGLGSISPAMLAKARAAKVEGDTLVVEAIEKDGRPLVLVKAADGRWYVSPSQCKMFDL